MDSVLDGCHQEDEAFVSSTQQNGKKVPSNLPLVFTANCADYSTRAAPPTSFYKPLTPPIPPHPHSRQKINSKKTALSQKQV
jgi:hypothetical protein